MSRRAFMSLVAAAAVTAGCGANQPAADQPRTMLRVQNQSTLDMNIYLLAGSQRVRLGTATALTTTMLRIPSQFVFGASSLRFLADPIGATRTPVSESITVSPGDEVTLLIPAAANMFSVTGINGGGGRFTRIPR
ncbi:MAG: twin-arginine translocation signal domain-containing protein [Gemmatimonadota bacterium]